MSARRLGQDEQYLTVREILAEASTLSDGALSRERSDFYRFGYATLGLSQKGFDEISLSTYWVSISDIFRGGLTTK